jgi:hypothetical protein
MAQLFTTELVTNSILHTGSPMVLTVDIEATRYGSPWQTAHESLRKAVSQRRAKRGAYGRSCRSILIQLGLGTQRLAPADDDISAG